MIEAIGGYFELELRKDKHYHKNAICLNSARNCFEYILLARKYTKVYIPYYTCEVLLQPLQKHGIHYEFYSINTKLEPVEIVKLQQNEAFLYTNYFGLKQDCVERLISIYGTQLIVDNAQAFFAPRLDSIDTFYSPRKFFGVPDGGFLYTDCVLKDDFLIDKSYGRMKHLLLRIEEGAEKGYLAFRESDDSLDNRPIRRMSKLTERILQSVNYDETMAKRRANFKYLHNYLCNSNRLSIYLEDGVVPMVYPYYANDHTLRHHLISRKVFVPTYWPNVQKWCSSADIEYALCNQILPLPIDQRYGKGDMKKIIEIIFNY